MLETRLSSALQAAADHLLQLGVLQIGDLVPARTQRVGAGLKGAACACRVGCISKAAVRAPGREWG